MPVDIVRYNGDIESLISMIREVKLLGFDQLVIVVEHARNINPLKKKIKEKINENLGLSIFFGALRGKETRIDRHIIPVWTPTRRVFESRIAGIILWPEIVEKRDKLHYRSSGMDEYLSRKAYDNHKVIVGAVHHLLEGDIEKRARIIGRMMQNAMLANKNGFIYAMASMANNVYELIHPRELRAIANIIGLHPSFAKKSIEWLDWVIE
ncbi:hypothetical protein J7K74_00080 [Candidatus Woesearchaeota archaeon]|nr:hypothetical protein [Candidatus Woesearchaeota archaeon]